MKSLKILTLFFAFFLLGAHTSFSQSQEPKLADEQKKELAQNMKEYAEALYLSEFQKPEFQAITIKYFVHPIF